MSLPRNGENNPSDTKGISGSDTGSRTAQEVAVDEADAWLFKKSKAKLVWNVMQPERGWITYFLFFLLLETVMRELEFVLE